jgi:hypothetical protein
MAENSDRQLKELLKVEGGEDQAADLLAKNISQVRAGVGVRDTLMFAIVRIWTVIAQLLAPVFAMFAVRKAELDVGRKPGSRDPQRESTQRDSK